MSDDDVDNGCFFAGCFTIIGLIVFGLYLLIKHYG